ncbi:nucleoside triphosphate pyrophosphohydrolase [bacterium]|nr:nucleoside triphosphate pyrophosphohydrolase [bacterium]
MKKLIDIVKKLRSPDGCPWDKKQTHSSLIHYILEEAWEVIEEIKQGRTGNPLKEELGDLLLQIALHAQIADEEGRFNFDDIVDAISTKMVARHPHVFKENGRELTDKELTTQWQELKSKEKKDDSIKNCMMASSPSLMNALAISKKAANLGFDWETAWDVFAKVEEELEEVKQEMQVNNIAKIEEEIGDLLFTITNLARFYKINPEVALKKGNDKFIQRFESLEKAINEASEKGKSLSMEEMESRWNLTKQ